MRVVLASKNKHKLEEISKITEKFGIELVLQSELGVDIDLCAVREDDLLATILLLLNVGNGYKTIYHILNSVKLILELLA